MKNSNILASFKNKRAQYGGYAALMIALVLAILIVINLVVGQFSIKLDLTENKMFSLSQQTYDIIDALDQDITIYALVETGEENIVFDEVLQKYSDRSNSIKVEYRDPVLYPQFASQYDKEGKGISEGSLIVVGENDKFKVIDSFELLNYTYTQQGAIADSLAVEQRVTGAIQYIVAEKNPVIYVLQGHDEVPLPYQVTDQLAQENYIIKDLNLVAQGGIPEDGDILFVLAPQRDISKEEVDMISDFLSNQGRAIFLTNISHNEMTNFEEVINEYGISMQKALVLEESANHQYQNPIMTIPNQQEHEITNPLRSSKVPIIIPGAQSIESLQVKKDSIDISPLLSSSEDSYGKTNLNSTVLEKEEGDLKGPLDLAVAITDKWYQDNEEFTTKVVVIGNTQFLDPQINALSAGGNMDFFLNSVNWLIDKEESISIRPKSLAGQPLNMNLFQVLIFSGISVILIPVIIGIIGLTVWLRRRNR